MRGIWQRRVALVFMFVPGVFFTSFVHAEQDIQFARALVNADRDDFHTGDLVERVLTCLRTRNDFMHELDEIEATYCRRQAQRSDNSEIAREFQSKAARCLLRVAAAHKSAADELFPAFRNTYEKYSAWQNKHATDGESPRPPANLLDPLNRAFEEWIAADRSYVNATIEWAEYLEMNDPERKKLIGEVTRFCERRCNQEILPRFFLTDFPFYSAWYTFIAGRAFALADDESNARRCWKVALDIDIQSVPNSEEQQCRQLRKSIICELVKLNMRLKHYGEVTNLLCPTNCDGIFQLFHQDEDAVKLLMVQYAQALTLPEDANENDYGKAVGLLHNCIVQESRNREVKVP